MPVDRSKEPSRISTLCTIGAEPVDAGVTAADVDAWRGLLACELGHLAELAENAGLGGKSLLAALPDLLRIHRDVLTTLGQQELQHRRRERYLADCASWEATPEVVKQGRWRGLRMTRGQRFEVIRTCQRLGIEPPGPLTRGEAADWLNRNGANLNYRQGE